MFTNSELPMCMLHRNEELNNMDFVLFHLYKENKEYREYYNQLHEKEPTRLTILDNSAYEFYIKGEELVEEEYIKAIEEYKPSLYICPDVLMDKEKTLELTIPFLEKYAFKFNRHSLPLCVIQGNTATELIDCLKKYYRCNQTCIAIPFHNSFFKEYADEHILNEWRLEFGCLTEDMKYAAGRCSFLNQYKDVLSQAMYIHLLGSHNPWERFWIEKNLPGLVNSMDTGYPVKVGYAGYELFQEPGKPEVIIDDFLNEELDVETQERIARNVLKFKG